jgi:phosphatidylserine synthase
MIRRSKQHLVEAGETYFEHLGFAATVGLMALAAGLACLIHALVPALCTRTASRTIGLLNQLLADRRRVQEVRNQSIEAIAFAALIVAAAMIPFALLMTAAPIPLATTYGVITLALPVTLLLSNPELEACPA